VNVSIVLQKKSWVQGLTKYGLFVVKRGRRRKYVAGNVACYLLVLSSVIELLVIVATM